MKTFQNALLGSIVALALAGCSSTGAKTGAGSSTETHSPSGMSGSNTGTTNDLPLGTGSSAAGD